MLVDIQNTQFPMKFSRDLCNSVESVAENTALLAFFRKADRHFAHYFRQDPLRLILIGEKKNQILFKSITGFQEIIIGAIHGAHEKTTLTDLGKMTWSLVKEGLAGANEMNLSDLQTAQKLHHVVSGIEAVGLLADMGTGATLFVEEDYHVMGQIIRTDHSLGISEADVREIIDDAVDIIIETVLETGGNVIFLDANALVEFRRIALIMGG